MSDLDRFLPTQPTHWVIWYDTATVLGAYRLACLFDDIDPVQADLCLPDVVKCALDNVSVVTKDLDEPPVAFSITKKRRPVACASVVAYCDLCEGDNYLKVPIKGFGKAFEDGTAKEKYSFDGKQKYQILFEHVQNKPVLVKTCWTLAEAKADVFRLKGRVRNGLLSVTKI